MSIYNKDNFDKDRCDFYAKIDHGHIIRSCAEILKGYITSVVWFDIKTDGTLEIRGADAKNTVSLSFKFDQFSEFLCRKRQQIGIEIASFHRLIKNCKKKSSLEIFILKKDADMIHIIINGSDTFIKVQRTQPYIIKEPTGYSENPCIIPTKAYQEMCKELHLTSIKKVTIKQQTDGKLAFESKNVLYGKTVPLGTRIEGETRVKYPTISKQFDYKNLSKMIKLPNISQSIRVFFVEGLPMKITFSLHSYGEGYIYIKPDEASSHGPTVESDDVEYDDLDA